MPDGCDAESQLVVLPAFGQCEVLDALGVGNEGDGVGMALLVVQVLQAVGVEGPHGDEHPAAGEGQGGHGHACALHDERGGEDGHGRGGQGERILRAEGASSIFGGNAVEDEEAEQGRDGAGRKTQHERARDEQRERRQKAQPQDSQGHAGERQDVPGAETQLVGERRVAERASEHAGGHGRQHVAEQLGAVRGSEVHRQDEALEGAHDHDHAETDEHGRAQNCEGAAAAFSLCARSAMTVSMPRSMRPYTSCWASL